MQNEIDDGGPAFPHLHHTCQRVNESEYYEGMSLRDYFAAKAFERLVEAHIRGTVDDLSKDIIAHEAYSYADAMLKARQVRSEEPHAP